LRDPYAGAQSHTDDRQPDGLPQPICDELSNLLANSISDRHSNTQSNHDGT
jgi:hypothetical protein